MAINPSETPVTSNPACVADSPEFGRPIILRVCYWHFHPINCEDNDCPPGSIDCTCGLPSRRWMGGATPLSIANELSYCNSRDFPSGSPPGYTANGGGEALDRANDFLNSFWRYSPPAGRIASGCGTLGMTCHVSAAGGNLVIQFRLPVSGPCAPYIMFVTLRDLSVRGIRLLEYKR